MSLERRAFVVRKRVEHEVGRAVYFPSLSCRTLIYKGMLTAPQLSQFFLDIVDERVESAIALVHSRYSTNTFPSWPLAHPYRYIAHNGEINTVQGNRNWMRAREALLESDLIPGDLERIFPIVTPGGSDTASFDEVLELLHLGGRRLPHAVLMMIPEAWENHASMSPEKRAFYRFHASLMEPWDGPASIAFTDGTVAGAVLDRNGLRPSRYWVTDDDRVIMASEVGVIDIDPSRVVKKGRLQPGRMFLVDTSLGRIVGDDEIKTNLAAELPYDEWLHGGLVHLDDLPDREHVVYSHDSVMRRLQTFGYTHEELKILIAPMAANGAEPIGSMGTDTPDRRAVGSVPPALRLLPAAVRAGDEPAARRDPRGAGHVARLDDRAGGQPARADTGVVPADCAPVPDHRQRRARQAHPHQRRRRHARLRRSHVARSLSRRRGRRRRSRRRSTRSATMPARRSPAAPASSCSPTATRPRSSRRSRRC